MADLLLDKETIYAEDIEAILGKSAQAQKEEQEKLTAAENEGATIAPSTDGGSDVVTAVAEPKASQK